MIHEETVLILTPVKNAEKAIGEASTLYLNSQKAPYCIKHYMPIVKCIAILRNPVDRAYSHFLLHRLLGKECLKHPVMTINLVTIPL